MKSTSQWDIVTDGSFYNHVAAYAWIIHDGPHILFTGQGSVPGNPPTALRAEFYAVAAWHCVLYHVFNYLDLTTNINITPYTDNSKVIHYYDTIQNNTILQLPYVDDSDVYTMLKFYYNKLRIRGIIFHPIQKIPKYKNDPSIQQSTNVLMHQQADTIARQYRATVSSTLPISPPQQWIHLSDTTGIIKSNEKRILETNLPTYNIEEYYIQR